MLLKRCESFFSGFFMSSSIFYHNSLRISRVKSIIFNKFSTTYDWIKSLLLIVTRIFFVHFFKKNYPHNLWTIPQKNRPPTEVASRDFVRTMYWQNRFRVKSPRTPSNRHRLTKRRKNMLCVQLISIKNDCTKHNPLSTCSFLGGLRSPILTEI